MQLRAPRTYASRIILIFNLYISSKKKKKTREYFTFVRNQDNIHPFSKKLYIYAYKYTHIDENKSKCNEQREKLVRERKIMLKVAYWYYLKPLCLLNDHILNLGLLHTPLFTPSLLHTSVQIEPFDVTRYTSSKTLNQCYPG